MPAMEILTSRFGPVAIEPLDAICFPTGLLGLDGCSHWVLLGDAQNDALGWLQSTSRPEIALAVVSPRRFVPDYQVRVSRSELSPLSLDSMSDAQVLVIVSTSERSITLNLKAPLVINRQRHLGRQVVANGDQPLQYVLGSELSTRKRSA